MEKVRKTDRRTLYTKEVIKDALLELEQDMSYDQINVTKICKQAEISRATFYLHYKDMNEVLDTILEDALMFSEEEEGTLLDTLDVVKNGDAAAMKEKDALLPACQRIADSGKYRDLFMDAGLTDYIIGKIASHERSKVVPGLMERGGISEADAEVIFQFILHGSFAVNQGQYWCKTSKWYHLQELLGKFVNGGLDSI
ncbi:MAG: TetR/AcrR family transcriptional regulator [Lachnospiraceae bacterium]|nr:TetR/AcrR family transcriptional regulator [Lachnospiraceae bacterium]